MAYDYSINSAHAVNEKYKREEAERQVRLAYVGNLMRISSV